MKYLERYSEFILKQYSKITSLPSNLVSLSSLQKTWLVLTVTSTPAFLTGIIINFAFVIDQYQRDGTTGRYSNSVTLLELDDFLGFVIAIAMLLTPALVYWFFDYGSRLVKWVIGDNKIHFSLERNILINIALVLLILALSVLIIRWISSAF
jgi:hypothetical protein